MKKYWFTLYPNTFLWVKGNDGFIYNADNYGKLKFCNEGQIAELTKLLLDVNSLYCVELTENSLGDRSVNEWVHNIIDAECGSLIEITATSQRPLSLPPVLKVQDDTEYYEWEHRQNIDGNIMQNLHNLIFFIATIQDLARELSQAKELSAIANINLLITDNLMSDSLAEITSWSDDISYTFIITSEQEYETAAQCSESLNLKNSNITPVYNGVNLPFIEECLYLNESPLGTIDETPHGIVYHELTTGNSWLRIRNQPPCSNCIFQWLCPSPSNYESVIGKPNLCHVKP